MNWKKIVLLVGFAIIFFQVLIVFPDKIEKLQEPQFSKNFEKKDLIGPEQLMRGIHFVESDGNARDWEMYADSAEGSRGVGVWKIFKVKVHFYNNDRKEFTVSADSGSIDSSTRDIRFKGNVNTISYNGYEFKSSEINYSAKNRTLFVPSKVVMKGIKDFGGDEVFISGSQLYVFIDQKKMLIPENVEAVKRLDNGVEFKMKSRQVILFSDSKEAQFLDKVFLNYQNLNIEAPAALLKLSNQSSEISSIFLNGGVRMQDLSKLATSSEVFIDLSKKALVLKGKPKVMQDEDELNGEEIHLLEGGKKVKIEKSKK